MSSNTEAGATFSELMLVFMGICVVHLAFFAILLFGVIGPIRMAIQRIEANQQPCQGK